MANPFLIIPLTLTLLIEPVMTRPQMDYDKVESTSLSSLKQPVDNLNISMSSEHIVRDNINTRDSFEGIVQFEKLIAKEKLNLWSPVFDFNDDEDGKTDIHTHFYANSQKDTKCLKNIDNVIKAARSRLPWALQMIDATGTPSSGFLRGNNLYVGDFDECLDVETGLDFDGQYCTTTVVILEIDNTSLSSDAQFSLGLCFPSSCGAKDVENYINTYFQSQADLSAIALRTHCQERHLSLTSTAKMVICICSIFVTLLVIGTFYDVFYKRWWLEEKRQQYASYDRNGQTANGSDTASSQQTESEHRHILDPKLEKKKLYSNNETAPTESSTALYDTCDKVLMSFSVYTNTARLFTVNQSHQSIDCINGMRFISMTWIMLLHTYAMGNPVLENLAPYMEKSNTDWTFMPIVKSVNAVDTFFAMSGLLMTYLVLKQLTKEKLTPKFFGVFYLHRYFRLTPPYMLVLMTYVPLFKYLSDGPFWPQDIIEPNDCDYWWANLLYVNNIAISYKKMCMGWSWYLSNDFQFYLVSPLLFLPMVFYQWKGLIVPLAFLLGNAICSGVISNSKDIISAIAPYMLQYLKLYEIEKGQPGKSEYKTYDDFFDYYYLKPYTRIGPFIIGMMTGFLLFKSECKARMSKLVVVIGWMAATAIALAVVYGLYDHVRLEDRQSTDVRALYNALHSIAWGVSVCWVIFACANGYGGFVNTLLSWKALVPLSRLTYCAYLVHPVVVQFYFFSQRKPFYINGLNMSFAFAAVLPLSYAVAYIAYLAYEIPFVGLEKIFRGRGKTK